MMNVRRHASAVTETREQLEARIDKLKEQLQAAELKRYDKRYAQ